MAKRLVIFVEGNGDVAAVPTLAQRVVQKLEAYDALFVDHEPFRVRGLGTLVKNNCFDWHRWIGAAGNTRANLGAILLVLDGDLDHVPRPWSLYFDRFGNNFCAYHVAALLGQEARTSRAGNVFSLATVFAMKEFEAWLIAGVEGLRGQLLPEGRGAIPLDASFPGIDVEAERDAKRHLRRIVPAYSETLDQGALAAHVDLDRALERCRSFRRFENSIRQLADSVRNGAAMVSPGLDAIA